MGRTYNVNEGSKRTYINVNDERHCGKIKRSGSTQAKVRRAQRIADDLVRKFGPASQGSYSYFCKCAYRLPESVIWDCYEASCGGRIANKLAYFLTITKAQPQMRI